MNNVDARTAWDNYRAYAFATLTPILSRRGYELLPDQPHLMGERFLTGPLAGGRKLVLLGMRTSDNQHVVIKAADDTAGIRELEHERLCRRVLARIRFAYEAFHTPEEYAFIRTKGFVIMITEFIEQEQPFLERSITEQFALALSAFKAQEKAHATTYEHMRLVARTFGHVRADTYCKQIQKHVRDISALVSSHTHLRADATLEDAERAVCEGSGVVEQYGGFLVHWDFTPQNFRIRGGVLYLLDASSLRFGSKYEGWARFINFMTLYHPELSEALVHYVHDNRTPEESAALRLMRLFRLVELIRYYASWLAKTDGDLHALAEARIIFWTKVLRAVLDDVPVPFQLVEEYRATRDRLRSPEEQERQRGLH